MNIPRDRCNNGHDLSLPDAFVVVLYHRRQRGRLVPKTKRRCRSCWCERQAARRKKFIAAGRCRNCGQEPAAGKKRCSTCLAQRAKSKRRCRRRLKGRKVLND